MNEDWFAHLQRGVAAISEGFCPDCSRRLAPVPGAQGTTGRCAQCGTWRAFSERERREGHHDTWTAWTPLPRPGHGDPGTDTKGPRG